MITPDACTHTLSATTNAATNVTETKIDRTKLVFKEGMFYGELSINLYHTFVRRNAFKEEYNPQSFLTMSLENLNQLFDLKSELEFADNHQPYHGGLRSITSHWSGNPLPKTAVSTLILALRIISLRISVSDFCTLQLAIPFNTLSREELFLIADATNQASFNTLHLWGSWIGSPEENCRDFAARLNKVQTIDLSLNMRDFFEKTYEAALSPQLYALLRGFRSQDIQSLSLSHCELGNKGPQNLLNIATALKETQIKYLNLQRNGLFNNGVWDRKNIFKPEHFAEFIKILSYSQITHLDMRKNCGGSPSEGWSDYYHENILSGFLEGMRINKRLTVIQTEYTVQYSWGGTEYTYDTIANKGKPTSINIWEQKSYQEYLPRAALYRHLVKANWDREARYAFALSTHKLFNTRPHLDSRVRMLIFQFADITARDEEYIETRNKRVTFLLNTHKVFKEQSLKLDDNVRQVIFEFADIGLKNYHKSHRVKF